MFGSTLFFTEMFNSYDRVVGLDVDILIRSDIAELYSIELGDCYIGACRDLILIQYAENDMVFWAEDLSCKDYIQKRVGLKNYKDYFNAGVMVLNLSYIRSENWLERYLLVATEWPFTFYEQDPLNRCFENKVFFLDAGWNYTSIYEVNRTLGIPLVCKNIYLIHFAGSEAHKPWASPDVPFFKEYRDCAGRTKCLKNGLSSGKVLPSTNDSALIRMINPRPGAEPAPISDPAARKKYLQMLELHITQCCNLRCLDCANLMQYHKTPKHYSAEQVCADYDRAISAAGFVGLINIIGGEPTLHPQLADIINHICANARRVASVHLVTNGVKMISDDVMKACRDGGVTILISNYGKLSKQLPAIYEKAAKEGVVCFAQNVPWIKCCNILSEPDDTPEEIQRRYSNCGMTCRTLQDGKFYRCSFLSNAYALGAVPEDPLDYVYIWSENYGYDVLYEYLNRKTALPGCRYCSGWEFDESRIVTPAIQVKSPLEYRYFHD